MNQAEPQPLLNKDEVVNHSTRILHPSLPALYHLQKDPFFAPAPAIVVLWL